MSRILLAKRRPLRAFLLGPVFHHDFVDGVQLALRDVANQLNKGDWQVDDQIRATSDLNEKPITNEAFRHSAFSFSLLSVFQRQPLLLATWMNLVPLPLQQFFSTLFMPRAYFESISHSLYIAERSLDRLQKYDLVILCVDGAPPGMSAFVAEKLKRVAFISLAGLASELSSNCRWAWGRRVAYWHLRGQVHPYLFRPILPCQIPTTIFASAQWRKEAVSAGLDASQAHTIYFGIPPFEPPQRSVQISNRLLWVGRLSPEKGLHLLLDAMPVIRRQVRDVTLTIIAGQGSSGYRQLITETIKAHGLEEVVTILPSMERSALQAVYATHDVLFFHSIFAEPVALVLMEAFAAGLPVVASQACAESKLVQNDVTCLCYQPTNPESLTRAVVTMLTDANVRRRVATNAQQLAREEFSLDKMGQAYDEVLRRLV